MNCIVLFGFVLLVCTMIFIHHQKVKKIELFMNKIDNSSNLLDLFTFSTFSSECCPSTYTTSSGCLCNYRNEHETITSRGGNRYTYKCDNKFKL